MAAADFVLRRVRGRPRLQGVVEIGRDLAREWQKDRVGGLAAEVAFFGILGFFPALLAMAAALGTLDTIATTELASDAEEAVIGFLEDLFTEEGSDLVAAVEELFEGGSPGLLTVGLAVALWGMSRSFNAVIRALNVAYGIPEQRKWVRQRALALALSLGSALMLAVMLGFLIVGPALGRGQDVADAVGLGSVFALVWDWLRIPAALALLVGWATTIYHVAPNQHATPWKWDLPGAVMASVLWALFSTGFRIYLGIAGAGNEVLGVLGGAVIVLLWLYLLSLGLLLGGELNAVLASRRSAAGRGS